MINWSYRDDLFDENFSKYLDIEVLYDGGTPILKKDGLEFLIYSTTDLNKFFEKHFDMIDGNFFQLDGHSLFLTEEEILIAYKAHFLNKHIIFK